MVICLTSRQPKFREENRQVEGEYPDRLEDLGKSGARSIAASLFAFLGPHQRMPDGTGMSSSEISLNSIRENSPAQIRRAMSSAHPALRHSRGVVGADGSVPGTTVPSSRCDRTPTGNIMKNASHHAIEITINEPAIPIT